MRSVLLEAKQSPGPFLVSCALCGALSYFLFSAAPIDVFASAYYSAGIHLVLPLAAFFPCAHLVSFALVSALLVRRVEPGRRIALGFGLVGLGIGSELIQLFLAHRSVQAIDLIANLGGIGCGFALGVIRESSGGTRPGPLG